MSAYIVSYVTRRGDTPRSIQHTGSNEAQIRSFCAQFAKTAHAVALHEMGQDAVCSLMQRWEGGRAKRMVNGAVMTPAVVIAGEVEETEDETTEISPPDFGAAQDAQDELEQKTYNGYCMKCKEKRDFPGTVEELANGSLAARGKCPVCGTGMFRMLSRNTEVEQMRAEAEGADEPTAEPVMAEPKPRKRSPRKPNEDKTEVSA